MAFGQNLGEVQTDGNKLSNINVSVPFLLITPSPKDENSQDVGVFKLNEVTPISIRRKVEFHI
ncbi:hypothetical protein D3C87_1996100 [compost metagenome]